MHVSMEVPTPFGQSFFERIAQETLKHCPAKLFVGKEEVTLNAVAVSQARIQELNRTYRGKDAVTDILSFGEYADTAALQDDQKTRVFLGELFFCQEMIVEAAREDAVTEAHEMVYVFSHGVLHLLGYDHDDEMFAIQDRVTESLMSPSSHEGNNNKSIV